VITGDFQDKYLDPTNRTVEGFKKLTEFIEPPIIGTLGNHDRIELAPQLESLPSHNGIRILLNETLKIKTKGGAKLILHGIDDPHYYKTHNIKKLNHKELKILLSHSPEVYKEAQTKEMDICLCGHTHAGQLRLPALGAVVKSAKVPKRLLQGTWCYKSLIGHTSPGLGCSGLSIRLLCPPEISILTLK
jgi:predicted MPP superfamily phosphohydrolase